MLDQLNAFAGVGVTGLGQEHPDQGIGRALVDNAGHEDVDLEAAKAPVRPVNRDDKVRLDRHQAQHHLGPGVVVEDKAREESLDTAIVRLLACRGAEGIGDFGQVDRGDLHQRDDKGNDEGNTRAIPMQVVLQHGVQFGIVEHGLVLLEQGMRTVNTL